VLRTHGGPTHAPAAAVNVVGTWVFRAVLLMTAVALLLVYRERRRPLRASRPRAVLAQADRETA
jgi:hypothetical protein